MTLFKSTENQILCWLKTNILIKHVSAYQQLTIRQKLYSKLYAYLIDTNAMCKAQLLKTFKRVPNNDHSSLIFTQGYNDYKLETSTLAYCTYWTNSNISVICTQILQKL